MSNSNILELADAHNRFKSPLGIENEEALLNALKADLTKAATALYVVPGVDSDLADASAKAVPEIVKSAPQSGIYGRITKFYTIPNGGIGVKYQMIRI